MKQISHELEISQWISMIRKILLSISYKHWIYSFNLVKLTLNISQTRPGRVSKTPNNGNVIATKNRYLDVDIHWLWSTIAGWRYRYFSCETVINCFYFCLVSIKSSVQPGGKLRNIKSPVYRRWDWCVIIIFVYLFLFSVFQNLFLFLK